MGTRPSKTTRPPDDKTDEPGPDPDFDLEAFMQRVTESSRMGGRKCGVCTGDPTARAAIDYWLQKGSPGSRAHFIRELQEALPNCPSHNSIRHHVLDCKNRPDAS